jgi:hypothetical protein
MSPGLAAEVLETAYQNDRDVYRATLQAVAQARKVRPVFLERQPRKDRHHQMLATLSRASMEVAAGSLIRGWLMASEREMLKEFLDSLGITHKDGAVEDLPSSVADDRLKSAVDALIAKHPHEKVAVYLQAFYRMNEAGWENLKTILESDSRLQLGG